MNGSELRELDPVERLDLMRRWVQGEPDTDGLVYAHMIVPMLGMLVGRGMVRAHEFTKIASELSKQFPHWDQTLNWLMGWEPIPHEKIRDGRTRIRRWLELKPVEEISRGRAAKWFLIVFKQLGDECCKQRLLTRVGAEDDVSATVEEWDEDEDVAPDLPGAEQRLGEGWADLEERLEDEFSEFVIPVTWGRNTGATLEAFGLRYAVLVPELRISSTESPWVRTAPKAPVPERAWKRHRLVLQKRLRQGRLGITIPEDVLELRCADAGHPEPESDKDRVRAVNSINQGMKRAYVHFWQHHHPGSGEKSPTMPNLPLRALERLWRGVVDPLAEAEEVEA